MLSPTQHSYLDAFGYLFFPQSFSADDMARITEAAEEIWREDPKPLENEQRRYSFFVERCPELTVLITDERIYPIVERLLGPDILWIGSEGNISSTRSVSWHSDRKYYRSGEEHWMDFEQIKVMLYLDEVDRDTGCLRVIPGSHKMPFHKNLAIQEVNPEAWPFGVDGPDIPCVALASKPGDMILFNHCIWHASFFGGERRRYLAFKFAAWPTADHHIDSMKKYSSGAFEPHEALVNHNDPRIRAMVRVSSVDYGKV